MNASNLILNESWYSTMITCWCGDVFQASGEPDGVRAEQREWEVAHKDCKEHKREGVKYFWMSFCDGDRPKGQQFLGACVMRVTAEEADEAVIDVMLRFPHAQKDAEWIAAASKKAWTLGCNPGGAIATMEIPADHPNLSRYQLGVFSINGTLWHVETEAALLRLLRWANRDKRTAA